MGQSNQSHRLTGSSVNTRHKEIQVKDMHWGTSYRVTHQAVAREEGDKVGGLVVGEGQSRKQTKSYKKSSPSTRIGEGKIEQTKLLL